MIDGLLFVQGRIALLDSFLVVFVLAAYASFLYFQDALTLRRAKIYLLLTGLCFGLAIATKWTGAAPIGVLLIWFLARRRALPAVGWPTTVITFVVLPFTIYFASFVFNDRSDNYLTYLFDWHVQTWNFHKGLHTSHPYESRWWTWLYLARPVWYYYQAEGGVVRGIVALGNPILWWGSLAALLASLIAILRRRHLELLLALLAFFAAYVPWWVIGRTQFQYYLVGGAPFLFMLLAWWLVCGYQNPNLRPFVVSIEQIKLGGGGTCIVVRNGVNGVFIVRQIAVIDPICKRRVGV